MCGTAAIDMRSRPAVLALSLVEGVVIDEQKQCGVIVVCALREFKKQFSKRIFHFPTPLSVHILFQV
jgi:hypothetical protein